MLICVPRLRQKPNRFLSVGNCSTKQVEVCSMSYVKLLTGFSVTNFVPFYAKLLDKMPIYILLSWKILLEDWLYENWDFLWKLYDHPKLATLTDVRPKFRPTNNLFWLGRFCLLITFFSTARLPGVNYQSYKKEMKN